MAGPDAASLGESHPISLHGGGPAAPSERLELLEETLSVSKRSVKTGSVRISTLTETREEVAEAVLQHGVVDISRVPLDRVVDSAPPVRTEGDTTIIPVVEERLVVTQQLVLVEEIHVRRRVEQEVTHTPVTVRRQHVAVEHLDADGGAVP